MVCTIIIFACASRNLDYNTTLNNRIPTIVEKIMHGKHKRLIFPQNGEELSQYRVTRDRAVRHENGVSTP